MLNNYEFKQSVIPITFVQHTDLKTPLGIVGEQKARVVRIETGAQKRIYVVMNHFPHLKINSQCFTFILIC